MKLTDAPNLLDAPGSLVGRRAPRLGIRRLLHGRGRYVADISLPRMQHLCFVRSPHAHARIVSIDASRALAVPGVTRVITGVDLAALCQPFVAVAAHRAGHRSAPQYPLALERAVWQGQPVAAVLAASRAEAEDGAEQIDIEWEALPAVLDAEAAAADGAAAIHPELDGNLAFEFAIDQGDCAAAFDAAACVVGHTFRFERQTGVSLEARGLIADYDPSEGSLTVYHSHQSPFQMQDVFSKHLDIAEHKVRVIAPDVGGGFGVKINVYAEELAVAAASRLAGVPVKYCADRMEAFLADAHAREHTIEARIAVSAEGRITAMAFDDLAAIGAYGMPLRFNIAEGMMAITMAGAPYDFSCYQARTRSVYVNKNLIGMFRGVGMPLACAVTEVLMDLAATRMGEDPVAFKRRNFRPASALPCTTPGGSKMETVSFQQCLDRLVANMDYAALRADQAAARERGVYRGIGVATFVEQTSYGPPYYGPSDARISVQDACVLKLEPSGLVRCITSSTDQGQGTLTGLAQIVATAVGVGLEDVDVVSGDSRSSPYGGGAWGSRGMAVGGEAALKGGLALKAAILALAEAISGVPADRLDVAGGQVVEPAAGRTVMSVAEAARIGYFRQDTLPADFQPQMQVAASHVANHQHYYMANGVQGSYLELDPETGFIRLLGHWAVDDCGRVVNPLLVDEQVRGGVVQGIGAALYEECIYDAGGSLVNATLADYLVPMASEMPDIHVDHIETPEATTRLGAKGIGEAGTIGAIGALWVAVNDALKPFGAQIMQQPFTPERVLGALRAARAR
ncbi:xanthine dehydrogenase family protein molybdopterin-binding subunit [Pigmentiphaga soli]|uniref:Xanthine dehydrogenase family protein molybdopterin-binding subunit n=1 Tax=Pigmentiphaga soli TaxID=1007095 RepID=A0ABP8H3U0_9BURK